MKPAPLPSSEPTRAATLPAERKADLLHRLRRAEGQVRGLQRLLEEGADCARIAQQLLATRHALDSTYVRLNLSVAEQELATGQCEGGVSPAAVVEVLDRLQTRLGRSR
jgi:DNA-binding FrmR family transcriptional regulator